VGHAGCSPCQCTGDALRISCMYVRPLIMFGHCVVSSADQGSVWLHDITVALCLASFFMGAGVT
jgi:hypothetical protein